MGADRDVRGIVAGMTVLIVLGGLTATATASHPTRICLDVEPDEHFGAGNDGNPDYLAASVGATDAGHPPEQEGCVIADESSAEGTVVHFEVTGENDTDDSDTPESPDLTCTVPASSNECTVEPPEGFLHDQEIAAWIDFDPETVELDREEGPDEATEPGAAEPDATDVALWRWTHEEPQPQCNDGRDNDSDGRIDMDDPDCSEQYDNSELTQHEDRPYPITVTIDYGSDTFKGTIGSSKARCLRYRIVTIKKVREGSDQIIARTKSSERGRWRVTPFGRINGRYYARVGRHRWTTPTGLVRYCEADRSPRIRVG